MASLPQENVVDKIRQLHDELCCGKVVSRSLPSAPAPTSLEFDSSNISSGLGRLPIIEAFEFAEHQFLGDSVKLKGTEAKKFVVRNDLSLTYGQINGLAGDFYGTMEPICQGSTPEDRAKRFHEAWSTLFKEDSNAQDILDMLKAEVDSLKTAMKEEELQQGIFSDRFKTTSPWDALMKTLNPPNKAPNYFQLGAVNLDHFGEDAGIAYNTGHRAALELAATACPDSAPSMSPAERQKILLEAYTMNAFADHFLQDRFAAGHLRTPRQHLLDSLDQDNFKWLSLDDQAKNLCAKAMHDEDNSRGLWVQSVALPEPWQVFGDGHLLIQNNKTAVEQCTKSLQASVDEVYNAWQAGTVPPDHLFGAWTYAPVLASIKTLEKDSQPMNFLPMFDKDGQVRSPLRGPGPYTYRPVGDPEWIGVRQEAKEEGVDRLKIKVAPGKVEVSTTWKEIDDGDGGKHRILSVEGGQNVGQYTSYGGTAKFYEFDKGIFKGSVGVSSQTGGGYKDGSVELKIMGTGFSLGKNTEFSWAGNSLGFRWPWKR